MRLSIENFLPVANEDNSRSDLLRACFSFLVPVARFLLRCGVSFDEFVEIARIAYVKVGAQDYGLRGRQTNSSRIAAMTGISRREVTRVKDLLRSYEVDPRSTLSPLGDVMHHWYTNARYLDADGSPKKIPVYGNGVSFQSLVRMATKDIPPGAIKVELARRGVIVEDPSGYVSAARRAAVPENFDEKLITSISFNLRGLATTIAHNSNPERRPDSGRVERFVYSPRLRKADRERVRRKLREKIIKFTEEIDDEFALLPQGDETSSRVGLGVYYHEDDPEA